MKVNEKQHLLDKLSASHSETTTMLEGIDLELRVYDDTDWRIRDILGHIATWDREATKSLRAFLNGIEYFLPEILDEGESVFNDRAVEAQRRMATQQVVEEWKQARVEFKVAISNIPMNMFPGELLYPWGDERGSIAKLVEYMVEHDEEHRDEILKAVQKSQNE